MQAADPWSTHAASGQPVGVRSSAGGSGRSAAPILPNASARSSSLPAVADIPLMPGEAPRMPAPPPPTRTLSQQEKDILTGPIDWCNTPGAVKAAWGSSSSIEAQFIVSTFIADNVVPVWMSALPDSKLPVHLRRDSLEAARPERVRKLHAAIYALPSLNWSSLPSWFGAVFFKGSSEGAKLVSRECPPQWLRSMWRDTRIALPGHLLPPRGAAKVSISTGLSLEKLTAETVGFLTECVQSVNQPPPTIVAADSTTRELDIGTLRGMVADSSDAVDFFNEIGQLAKDGIASCHKSVNACTAAIEVIVSAPAPAATGTASTADSAVDVDDSDYAALARKLHSVAILHPSLAHPLGNAVAALRTVAPEIAVVDPYVSAVPAPCTPAASKGACSSTSDGCGTPRQVTIVEVVEVPSSPVREVTGCGSGASSAQTMPPIPPPLVLGPHVHAKPPPAPPDAHFIGTPCSSARVAPVAVPFATAPCVGTGGSFHTPCIEISQPTDTRDDGSKRARVELATVPSPESSAVWPDADALDADSHSLSDDSSSTSGVDAPAPTQSPVKPPIALPCGKRAQPASLIGSVSKLSGKQSKCQKRNARRNAAALERKRMSGKQAEGNNTYKVVEDDI